MTAITATALARARFARELRDEVAQLLSARYASGIIRLDLRPLGGGDADSAGLAITQHKAGQEPAYLELHIYANLE